MSNIVKNIIPIEAYYASLTSLAGSKLTGHTQGRGTVEAPVSGSLKCEDLAEPQPGPSEKKSRHIYFMEDNLLFAIFKVAP